MEEIDLLSLLTVFLLQIVGAYWHYRVVRNTGRHNGTLWQYLFAVHPQQSAYVIVGIAATSLGSAISGIAANINPELVWEMVKVGKLPLSTVAVLYSAIQSGYQFDSWLNKGFAS